MSTKKTAKTTKANLTPADFEKRIKQLKDIIDKLESDELPLDQSMKQFETGMKLAREAQDILTNAEQKIQILTDKHSIAEDSDAEDDDRSS